VNVITKANTLKNIKDGFEMAVTPRRININNKIFFIAKGLFLSETGIPLMVCAMKKEPYLNTSIAKFSDSGLDNFSYNNYVLFYSTSFYTDPSLTPLNRRLQKEILQSCYEKGIEVRTITSLEIEKNTFARLFEVKKTKSLTQLEAYMEQVLPNFLHNDKEDTFIEQEFAPVVLAHEEELSVEDEALLFDNEAQTEEEFDDDVIWDEDVDEARELAELEAEAATFNHPLTPEIDWRRIETELDQEEAAHTGSERNLTIHTSLAGARIFEEALRAEGSNYLPHPTNSLVERMRPLQDAYNMQMSQAQQSAELTTYVAGTDPYTSDVNSVQVGTVTWRNSRREGQIELIDDTE
jgi:DNA repair photolyase